MQSLLETRGDFPFGLMKICKKQTAPEKHVHRLACSSSQCRSSNLKPASASLARTIPAHSSTTAQTSALSPPATVLFPTKAEITVVTTCACIYTWRNAKPVWKCTSVTWASTQPLTETHAHSWKKVEPAQKCIFQPLSPHYATNQEGDCYYAGRSQITLGLLL